MALSGEFAISRVIGDGHGTVTNAAPLHITSFGVSAWQVAQAKFALVTVSGGAVRYRCTSNAPTTSIGHRIPDGEEREFPLNQLIGNIQFIAEGADTVITVTLFT